MSRRLVMMMALILAAGAWGVPVAEAAPGASASEATLGDLVAGATATGLACGGPGEVACINFPSLTYATPYKGCNNDRLNNLLNVCYACGGPGQPSCEFGSKCNVGYRTIPPVGTCSYAGYSAEPTTNVASMPALTQPATGPVRGIIDMHAHMFSNLGFGGVLFWGAPYDDGGINEALPWCDYSWKFPTTGFTGLPGTVVPFLGYEMHGPTALQPVAHPISLAMEEGLHPVAGTGSFEGWPTYQTLTHQQMYYKWVERAYLGGLRMMVQLAVSNEALCGTGKRRTDFTCDDMEAVDKQIQATKDLEKAIDLMDDGQRNGSGWYRVAYKPSEAREFIRNGKMAVVLGIEVDSLFGCKPGTSCSSTFIKGQLTKYWNLGVRHVFPIHQYDNGFGGAAIFRNELNAANRIVAGNHFQVRDCSAEGYDYNVGSSVATDFLALLLHGAAPPDQSYYDQFAADCNARGLTSTGRTLIHAMMDMGFIIDVDHMSRLMVDDVLDIARQRNYPLVSGHSQYNGGEGGNEFSLTDAQVATLKELGGMVSAITPKGKCSTSAGFAYQYRTAVAGMAASPGDPFAAVGFSTDMNGFGGSTGPRFFTSDCPAGTDGAPNTSLQYPFTGVMGGSFNVQRTGDHDFDFNAQGLAHYGLLADFFADLKNVGLTTSELEPLLNSAESYIRLWTRASGIDEVPSDPVQPSVRAIVSGTESPNGFAYVSDVHLSWEITGGDGYIVIPIGCQDQAITYDTGPGGFTFVCRADAYLQLPGQSLVLVATAQDAITIRRDTRPPTLVWEAASPAANAAGWHNSDVTFTFTARDVTTGVQSPPGAVVLRTEGTGVTGTVTLTDYAGNSATYTSPAVNIDKTSPEIVFAGLPPTNAAGWYRQDPTLVWTCTDALSGPVAAQVSQTLTVEGSSEKLTGRCYDRAGNQRGETRSGLRLDKTPPTLEWADAAPAANAAGWYNADVAFAFTPADALSGVATTSEPNPLVLTAEGTAVTGVVTVTDIAGNTATFTSPAVDIDRTPPAFVTPEALSAEAASAAGAVVTFDVSASDVGQGPIDATCAPVSGSVFALGATDVTCTATDQAGNEGTAAFTVTVADTTAPTVVAEGQSAEATGPAGAAVTFAASATDAVTGNLAVSCSPAAGTVFPLGSTTVTCTAVDEAGNTGSATATIVVADTTPPVLTVPAAIVLDAVSINGAPVLFDIASTDIVSGSAVPNCLPASGSVFPIGNTTVACTVADAAGNQSAGSFTVTVNDVTTPGEMRGDGFIRDRDTKYQFDFTVRERPSGDERGWFRLVVDEREQCDCRDARGRRVRHRDRGDTRHDCRGRDRDDRFDARTVDFVAFSDDPTFRPGRPRRPQVDTVLFSGTGRWNGAPGYRYEVAATDQGEPGRHRETVRIDIRDPGGALVAHVEGELDGGNVQSSRVHGRRTR
ncbi:MAG: HYR domain-containing protein [Vicinamibacterales bacterium]